MNPRKLQDHKFTDRLHNALAAVDVTNVEGRVRSVRGMLVEIAGPVNRFVLGALVSIEGAHPVMAEIVGFHASCALAMPFGRLEGVHHGCRARLVGSTMRLYPDTSWLGRVVDALGAPADGKGDPGRGARAVELRAAPPDAPLRARLGPPLDLGVRALNTFTTCCEGQRMGIFAGSGVGKSMLMSMLARYTSADIIILGLIGERGRELAEFIEDDLGKEGMKRAVVVAATSDQSALMRRQAAWTTLAIAEYFRDEGHKVLCVMDSVTRFAMAQREIGLTIGEPPASKGYTPSVFAELPRLLERAGPGLAGKAGSVTGIFTVLVDGDDPNEPVADAVRGILDGHIVLDRSIAERGRFPAINVLKSVSRTMPGCVEPAHRPLIGDARRLMADYADMEEIIRMGAYRKGSQPAIDQAIDFHSLVEAFIAQDKGEKTDFESGYSALAAILQENSQKFRAVQDHPGPGPGPGTASA